MVVVVGAGGKAFRLGLAAKVNRTDNIEVFKLCSIFQIQVWTSCFESINVVLLSTVAANLFSYIVPELFAGIALNFLGV